MSRHKVSKGERRTYYRARLMNLITLGHWHKTDTVGFHRVDEGGEDEHPWQYSPAFPALPLWGNALDWAFKKDEDIGTGAFDAANSGAGTGATIQDEVGTVVKFTNGAGDNNYYYYFSVKEQARLRAGKGLWFRTRFKILDVDQVDMFIGLCTRLGAGNLFDNRVDSMGFYLADGSASLAAEARKNSVATTSTGLATLTDDSYIEVAFSIVGTTYLRLYVNKAFIGTISTNLPDDEEMAFCFGARNGQAVANAMSVNRTTLIMDE